MHQPRHHSQKYGSRAWAFLPMCLAIVETVCISTNQASAQSAIVSDTTLGTDNSIITPDVLIRGLLSDRMDGGAIRGPNLFHSFIRFNVDTGRGAYFANPVGC